MVKMENSETNNSSRKKKQIKISLNKLLILSIIILISLGISLYFFNNKVVNSNLIEYGLDNDDTGFLGTYRDEASKYQLFNTYSEYIEMTNRVDLWKYDVVKYRFTHRDDKLLKSWNENRSKYWYDSLDDKEKEYLIKRTEKIKEELNSGKYDEKFFEQYSLLLVESLTFGEVVHEIKLKNVCIYNTTLNVNIKESSGGCVGGGDGCLFFITLKKKDIEEVKNINIKYNYTNTSMPGVAYKPIIYLYPTEEAKINVTLGNADKITCSYPKYTTGWNVIAEPNGDLKDLDTNKNLYALYYESNNTYNYKIENDGFVIKGENSANFLEEKLSLLGLNDREIEEFIIYWLPKLESNNYNYIRFATQEEINKNMPLEINPNPDTIIRVLMTFKGLDSPIEVQEQQFETPNRTGFVAVEWGGTEIK